MLALIKNIWLNPLSLPPGVASGVIHVLRGPPEVLTKQKNKGDGGQLLCREKLTDFSVFMTISLG